MRMVSGVPDWAKVRDFEYGNLCSGSFVRWFGTIEKEHLEVLYPRGESSRTRDCMTQSNDKFPDLPIHPAISPMSKQYLGYF